MFVVVFYAVILFQLRFAIIDECTNWIVSILTYMHLNPKLTDNIDIARLTTE